MSAPMTPIFCQQCGAPVTAVDRPAVRCAFCGTVLHRTGADSPLGVDVTSAGADEPSNDPWKIEVSREFVDGRVVERIVDGNRIAVMVFGVVMAVPILGGGLVIASQALTWLATTSDTGGRWQVLIAGVLAVGAAAWMLFWLHRLAEPEAGLQEQLRAFRARAGIFATRADIEEAIDEGRA